MNKIAVCCIAKNENRYFREWVEHYKSLNVDKIFLYDNNDANGERFEDVISDYIESGFVTIIDYRGRTSCQMPAYKECYRQFSTEYEWIAFFDADEFLELNDFSDIHDYLNQECFSDCNLIHINWMIFDDNDLVHYEDKPLKTRFTRPANFDCIRTYSFPENHHVKSIVRRGIIIATTSSI